MTLLPQKAAANALAMPPPGGALAPAATFEPPASTDRERLVEAVGRHSALVWRTLRRFGVPDRDVADAAQQVYLALIHRMTEVPLDKEASFLVAVAVRVAANVRRKLERSPEVLTDTLDTTSAPHTPEALLNEKQLREELDRGLLSLPLEQRAVFVLFELEGFSLPEIADALQIPLGTATSRLRRARGHFEDWVARRRSEAGGEP